MKGAHTFVGDGLFSKGRKWYYCSVNIANTDPAPTHLLAISTMRKHFLAAKKSGKKGLFAEPSARLVQVFWCTGNIYLYIS